MKRLVLSITCFFTVFFLKAQDKIYRKNGQVVNGKVMEVGPSEVKYKIGDSTQTLIYVLEKDRVKKIEFANGRVESYTPDLKDPEQYEGQLTKAIKVDFFGPLLGYSQITFEKSTGVGKSYELTLGIIGAGKNQRIDYYYNQIQVEKRSPFGLFAAAGYKFNKLPDFLFGRTRFNHLMQGGYAKPIVYLGNYSENRVAFKANNQYVVERKNTTFGALQVELGKQWVFGDKFLLDLYWGLGYGFDNKKSDSDLFYDDNTSAYNYANARLGRSPGFSTTFGLKTGLLIR